MRLVSDDRAKGLRAADLQSVLPQRLTELLGKPDKELLLVSPYFVPTASGSDALINLSKSGVAVSVLTNSLAATDVPAVPAGYAKRRGALLGGGSSCLNSSQTKVMPHARGGRTVAWRAVQVPACMPRPLL